MSDLLKAICAVTVSAFLMLIAPLPCSAEFDSDMDDEYLRKEFAWAIYLDAQDVSHYLDYEGSRLAPLSKVTAYYRIFPPSQQTRSEKKASKSYKDFWYHNGSLIGSRYRNQPAFEKDSVGAIVVGPTKGGIATMQALAGAVVRLVLDFNLQEVQVGMVLVPSERYDQFVGNLSRYHFFTGTEPEEGKQLSIHVSSYPHGKDDYCYYVY